MFITRREYNAMLKIAPIWMANVWCGIPKTWSLGGATLGASEDGTVFEVRYFLKEARKLLKGR